MSTFYEDQMKMRNDARGGVPEPAPVAVPTPTPSAAAALPMPYDSNSPVKDLRSLQAKGRATAFATADAGERSKRPQAAIGSTAAGNKGLGGVTMMPNMLAPGFVGHSGGMKGGAHINANLPDKTTGESGDMAPNPAITGLPVPEDETLEGFVARQMNLAGAQAGGVYTSGPYQGLTQGQAMERAKALGLQMGKKSTSTGAPAPATAPTPAVPQVTVPSYGGGYKTVSGGGTPATPLTQVGAMPPAPGMIDGKPARQVFQDAANRQKRNNRFATAQ